MNPDAFAGTDHDIDIDATNAAFDALELDCRWTHDIAATLASIPDEGERIATYLRLHRPHLLKSYPAEFLVDAISGMKARLRAER